MKILYVCDGDPRKKGYGSEQRTNLLWNELKKIGDVYTLCYKNPVDNPNDRIQYRWSALTGRLKRKLYGILEFLWDFIYKDSEKCLPVPYEFIDNPYSNVKFDIVVCRYIQPAARLHLWNIAPLYVDVDDHPLELFDTRDKYRIPVAKRFLARCLQRYMVAKVAENMTGGWVANENHKSFFYNKKRIVYLPNIPFLPSGKYSVDSSREGYLFFVGLMSYRPNYLGIDNFLMNVWPIVYKEFPSLRFNIAGKNAPSEYVSKWNSVPNVEYLGFVDDIEVLYEKCLAAVVPIEQGSGTCIKTLESMAHSRLCLSTPFGARGLDISECHDGLLIYNDAVQFVELLKNKVMNTQMRLSSERNLKDLIEKKYSIENFSKSVRLCLSGSI